MPLTGTKKFPLKEAYLFAASNGLAQEAGRIRSMETKWSKEKSYWSDVRRGYLIDLFQRRRLLDQFKQQCWPRGIGQDGDRECRHCLKVKADFDKELGI